MFSAFHDTVLHEYEIVIIYKLNGICQKYKLLIPFPKHANFMKEPFLRNWYYLSSSQNCTFRTQRATFFSILSQRNPARFSIQYNLD
jgi:hypothetical protein